MTIATFYFCEQGLAGFSVLGHSGFAPEGEDILCAAISSAVRLVECTITDVLDLEPTVSVEEGFVSLLLPSDMDSMEEESFVTCQNLLVGLTMHFVTLAGEYPEHLKVQECQEQVPVTKTQCETLHQGLC